MAERYIKKLNQLKYVLYLAVIAALLLLYWYLTRSFVAAEIQPINAKITIDNAPMPVNRYGAGKKIVTPGKHVVKVEADGYIAISNEIKLRRGGRTSLDIKLKKIPEMVLVEEGARFLSRGKDQNEIFYLDQAGKTLNRAVLSVEEGKIAVKKEPITNPRLGDIEKIIWSPNKDLALFKKKEGSFLFDFKKYDFVNQTEALWGKEIGEIAWSPDNSKIAYYYSQSNGEKTLIFSNIMNTEKTRVANLADAGITDPILRWSPDSDYLMLIPRNQDYSTDKIYIYNISSGSLNKITETGDQVDADFSPDGKKIIYTTYSKDSGGGDPFVLSIMNNDGSEKRNLGIRSEVSKVEWSSDQKGIYVSEYDKNSGVETFSSLNLDEKQKINVMKGYSQKRVDKLLLTVDNKVMLFENSDGIYAFNLE